MLVRKVGKALAAAEMAVETSDADISGQMPMRVPVAGSVMEGDGSQQGEMLTIAS